MQEMIQEEEKEAEQEESVQVMVLRAIREVEQKVDEGIDIAEIYSPKRVTAAAAMIGLRAGLAMDLTNGWDFRIAKHREAAERYVREVKPWLLIGSPECRMFSTLQNLSKQTAKKQADREEAEEHLKFVCKLYKIQVENGRKFLHEHPVGATSWWVKCIEEIKKWTV